MKQITSGENMFKKISLFLTISVFAFLSTQCSSDSNDDDPSSSSNDPSSSSNGDVASAAKLLVGFVYFGTDNSSGGSNSFVEIYNPNSAAVTLTGKYALHFKTMQRNTACTAGCRDDEAEKAAVLASPLKMQEWLKLTLVGTIPANTSFLVHMGPSASDWAPSEQRIDLRTKVFDQNFEAAYSYAHNKGIKIVITSNQNALPATLKNPFTGDGAGKIAGYLDMFGISGNDGGYVDQDVDGCESSSGTCAASSADGQSKQKGFVRISQLNNIKYEDTDDNLDDFTMVDFRSSDKTDPRILPRSLADGAWAP
jgi:hypothetical protein